MDSAMCPRCNSTIIESHGQRWCSMCDYVLNLTEVRKHGEKGFGPSRSWTPPPCGFERVKMEDDGK
jgi:uncharacterized Zn finger protein (UPF0148 family)